MKKVLIVSVCINILLLGSVIVLFNKYLNIKTNYSLTKKKDQLELQKKQNIDSTFSKIDPIYIFESQKFPCHSGYTSYESNLCTGEKLRFADSLLNVLVKNKIKMLDQEILVDKEAIEKTKGNYFFITALKSNNFKKIKLIKSQQLWNEMKILESKDVSLECGDAAAGCPGVVSSAEIKIVLQRMKEIKKIKPYN